MQRIGIREAKARLSKLLRDVRRGEEWVITERGHPIAKLTQAGPEAETVTEWLTRLEREGRLTRSAPDAKIPEPIDIDPSGIAQRMLREDRDGRC